MRISDWRSDVCSSYLHQQVASAALDEIAGSQILVRLGHGNGNLTVEVPVFLLVRLLRSRRFIGSQSDLDGKLIQFHEDRDIRLRSICRNDRAGGKSCFSEVQRARLQFQYVYSPRTQLELLAF